MDADLTSPPGLYRIRSLGEYLTPSADDAPEDSPVLLHAMERVEYWAARSFRTSLASTSTVRRLADRWLDPTLLVLAVCKRQGGVFQERISVGRTAHSDVCLPYPKVSKLHAYFRATDDGATYELFDANSTNGTLVDGARLKSSVPQRLPEDCVIRFGKHDVRFLMPAAFQRLLADFRAAQA